MLKRIEIPLFIILLIFAIYCALITGSSWDELYEMNIGKDRLKYLLSFGSYKYFDFHILTERYPAFYNTIAIFITNMFPKKYEIEVWHLINSLFSVLAIFGIYKITSNLFNKKVAKIVFILCFLNPIFFGHMAINSKDTIFAFAHIWSTCIFLKYIRQQHINTKRTRYILLAGLTIGLGTAVRLPFIVTLFPMLIFLIFEIFYLKTISSSQFSIKKFVSDLIKILLISYIITISTWPQVHGNIFIEPFKIFMSGVKLQDFGASWLLFNGNFFDTLSLPKSYIIINLIYKSPEFILFCYLVFIYIIFQKNNFFRSQFNFFWSKIFLILFIFLFPFAYFVFLPYRIYDGLRFFLYIIPYFSIIPALVIYYLFFNFNSLVPKFLISIISALFAYYIFIFVSLTPYQYTYLNILSGNFSDAHNKFENDYWAVSIKELVKKIPKETDLISNNEKIKISFCGVNHEIVMQELDKLKNLEYEVMNLDDENFDYAIMTNRSLKDKNINNLSGITTCFKKIKGDDLIKVERNNLMLSTLRKKL